MVIGREGCKAGIGPEEVETVFATLLGLLVEDPEEECKTEAADCW
jgi:hypothetical protein